MLEVLVGGKFNTRVSSGETPAEVELWLNHDPVTKQAELRLEARSLVGVMWMQLAAHVIEGAIFRRCEVCQNEFAVLPSDRRTLKRRTCSGSCRTRLAQKRKIQDDE